METSEDNIHNHSRKNTFLSRVFGVHSSDVGDSLETAEMSHFPIQIDRTSINPVAIPRVLESDQGSSSDEEEDEPVEESVGSVADNIRRFDGVHNTYEGGSEADEEFGDEDLEPAGSYMITKLGQGSSSDEEGSLRESITGDDIPLFAGRIDRMGNIGGSFDRKKDGSAALKRILKDKSSILLGTQRSIEEESFIFKKDTARNEDGYGRPPLRTHNMPSKGGNLRNSSPNRFNPLSPRERALWKWANVENLDLFLQDVYEYFLGNGFLCIMIEKVLNLLTLLFIVFISTYMSHCIDYGKIPTSHKFSEVKIDRCYSTQVTGATKLLLWIFGGFVILKVVQLYFDIKRLRDIRNFYLYLLNISDKELETISWQSIIQQIMLLKDQNAVTANVVEVKAKNRIDAHVVANRIMRKENYLISLYNKDILELSLNFPMYRTNILTKTLEWNIHLCIMGFAFNEAGFLKQSFLNVKQREHLSEELKKRFILSGFLNIILSPFLVGYFILLYFFRYFNEYRTSPGSLGTRQYTPIAEWRFREYNELYHVFKKRIGLSHEVANRYINQFPNTTGDYLFKFVKFVSGSFVAILGVMTVLDPENFLNFELTHDKSVLFYMTVFGSLWAAANGALSSPYNVFDPEESLKELISYTHYAPKEWEGKYHTDTVKKEFCELYNLRIILLMRELASLIMTPFILWFSLPKSADAIVDFFREVTVYSDGLGYVCKYAMFDVKQNIGNQLRRNSSPHVNGKPTAHAEESSDEESDKGVNKMMQSYMYFVDDYQNTDNAVGKFQIPKSSHGMADSKQMATTSNHNYSWKKQFQLGGKPEEFNIKSFNPTTITSSVPSKPRMELRARLDQGANMQNNQSITEEGEESFINYIPPIDYDRMERGESRGNGILGLLNQYYKKSDVGR
ncbi:HDL257Wp [Eremothecium sinecaudum]|uniref:Autophagy-related protein 9 n=1 Tax=Eremothecium sinecaudum TaxID=45286 RepID=A0A0X8HS64_9SACH|nr:HDL257Wp [Eremothecium sinecaudum]AMD20487.1 HDL257Wp [Eremothecium sinecaudum]